jgi:hypothetical protein
MIERTAAPITCILPLERSVYTGDEDGRVVSQGQMIPGACEKADKQAVRMGLRSEASLATELQSLPCHLSITRFPESWCVIKTNRARNW